MYTNVPLMRNILVVGAVSFLIISVIISGCTQTDRLADQAKVAFDSGRYAEAVSLYNQAIELSKSNSELYYLKGKALFELVRYKDAIDAFTQAIRINPQYHEAWYMKGRASYMMGDYDEAEIGRASCRERVY
jgi:tetratricopeptide (TPR) repeat protein